MPHSKYCTLLSAGRLTALLAAGLFATPPAAPAQTAPAAAPASRLIGTVTATSADSLTLKLESGGEVLVSVGAETRVVRTAPGATTLQGATMIHVQDLATGDRVSVRLAPGSDASHYAATAVIAMKQADIAQAHASQTEDWQKRGVAGVVKSIDPPAAATATITVSSSGHALQVAVTPTTIIRRYAPDSVRFADAKAATLADIHPGDQLRARGDHSEDGTSVTAVEIVSGSFRNVAGTITAIDTTQNTLTLVDLTTKKPVTLTLTPETQMRKLPPEMAQGLAARGARSGSAGPGPGGPAAGGDRPAASGGSRPAYGTSAGGPGGPHGDADARPHGDPSAMLQRAPAVTLAELKKGDAVMIVASRGERLDAATAITLIAGVEPLLQGSAGASDSLFSASWNMGGSAEASQ
ncbi:MAG TPA: DUF5666 domain-containing protein [Acidobacteriaceae bacterium]